MRRVLLLVLLALAVPLAASASSIDITNTGGTITGSTAGGLTLTGSVITVYGAITGPNLGSVTFTTPAFSSGNVTMGGTIGAGGTITITGNGSVSGVPNGVIFTGTFTSATWQVVGSNYVLLASIVSTSGATTGVASELTVSGTLGEDGTIKLSSGDISLTTAVPEPGTLGLLGTGLVGIGGLLRKRFLR